jgi:hypothetical protein
LLDYERLTDIDLRSFMTSGQELDLLRWFKTRAAFENSATEWIVGASYLEENAELLARHVRKSEEARIKPELQWLRPAGEAWGLSEDLASTLDTLRRSVGLMDMPRAKGTLLITPKNAATHSKKRVQRLYGSAILAPPRLGTSLEIIIAGQVAAAAVVHLPIGPRDTASIGIVTSDPRLVTKLSKQLAIGAGQVWTETTARGDGDQVRQKASAFVVEE